MKYITKLFFISFLVIFVFSLIQCSNVSSEDRNDDDDDDEPVQEIVPQYNVEGPLGLFPVIPAATIRALLDGSPDIEQFVIDLGFQTDQIQYDISYFKITYNVTFNSRNFQSSALIVVPQRDENEELSLVSVQHGTRIADYETPSAWTAQEGITRLTIPEGLIDALVGGHLTVDPDYFGFGDSMDIFDVHPYHVADTYATDGIAAIRVAKAFAKRMNIKLNGNLFLRGYSEGGFATLALQRKIESDPDIKRELKLTAVAAGAGAYNLLYTSSELISGRFSGSRLLTPSYIPYVYLGYEQVYQWDESRFNSIFQGETDAIRSLFDGTKTRNEIEIELESEITSFLQPEAIISLSIPSVLEEEDIAIRQFKERLIENSVHTGWKPESPTRLYVCTNDDIVPSGNTTRQAAALVDNNVKDSTEHLRLDILESALVKDESIDATHVSCPLYATPILEWFGLF